MDAVSRILDHFRVQRKVEELTYKKKLLEMANETFKTAIFSASWLLYVTAVLLIASFLYFCFFEHKDRRAYNRRVREIQHIVNRVPPKRRPGAVAREREIFQKVTATAHSYIYPNNSRKQCVLRQTRSGTIYGKYEDDANQVEK